MSRSFSIFAPMDKNRSITVDDIIRLENKPDKTYEDLHFLSNARCKYKVMQRIIEDGEMNLINSGHTMPLNFENPYQE